MTARDLRRTFCGFATEETKDPFYVQQQMGHSDARFTLRVYNIIRMRATPPDPRVLNWMKRGRRRTASPRVRLAVQPSTAATSATKPRCRGCGHHDCGNHDHDGEDRPRQPPAPPTQRHWHGDPAEQRSQHHHGNANSYHDFTAGGRLAESAVSPTLDARDDPRDCARDPLCSARHEKPSLAAPKPLPPRTRTNNRAGHRISRCRQRSTTQSPPALYRQSARHHNLPS